MNTLFPILHRPSFENDLRRGVHLYQETFGGVVLLVCAIGSRFSTDRRVVLDEVPSEAESGPHWLPYFCVGDVDTVLGDAVRLGGAVTLGPMDVPDVGVTANLTDPYGASFAVIKPAPMG